MRYAIIACVLLFTQQVHGFDLKPIPPVEPQITFVSLVDELPRNVELPPIPAYSDGGPWRQVCDKDGCRLQPVGLSRAILGNMDSHSMDMGHDKRGFRSRREGRAESRGDREGFLRALLDRLFGGRGDRAGARRARRGGGS